MFKILKSIYDVIQSIVSTSKFNLWSTCTVCFEKCSRTATRIQKRHKFRMPALSKFLTVSLLCAKNEGNLSVEARSHVTFMYSVCKIKCRSVTRRIP